MRLSDEYKKELYRKGIHLSSLWMPAIIYFAPKIACILLFSIIVLGDMILEYGNYKKWGEAQKIFHLFLPTLRKKELRTDKLTFTGGIYVSLAALLCSVFFAKPIAVIALSIMLISDTSAALVGKIFGKHKIYKNKSVEGSLAFFISAIFVTLIFNSIYPFSFVCIIACLAATLMELYESALKIDDNLSIPLAVGLVLSLF